jgi:hypothetical protein
LCNRLPTMRHKTHVALALAVLVSLLAPTVLCAVPTSALGPGEHDCCEQMKEMCQKPSMSACCTIVPNTALGSATLGEKSSFLPNTDIQHAAIAYANADLSAPLVTLDEWEESSFSPPRFPDSASIQILRI